MENADRVQNSQAGRRARGWRKNWRPTFHLSTAGSNQRNPRTDRLACVAPQMTALRSRSGRDPGNTIIPEGFPLLSPKPIRGYTPYQIGVLGSRTPLDNLRRMYAFVGGPRRAPLAGSPNPGNSNG